MRTQSHATNMAAVGPPPPAAGRGDLRRGRGRACQRACTALTRSLILTRRRVISSWLALWAPDAALASPYNKEEAGFLTPSSGAPGRTCPTSLRVRQGVRCEVADAGQDHSGGEADFLRETSVAWARGSVGIARGGEWSPVPPGRREACPRA